MDVSAAELRGRRKERLKGKGARYFAASWQDADTNRGREREIGMMIFRAAIGYADKVERGDEAGQQRSITIIIRTITFGGGSLMLPIGSELSLFCYRKTQGSVEMDGNTKKKCSAFYLHRSLISFVHCGVKLHNPRWKT